MLSVEDLKYYCRTCLVKLENSHNDDSGKTIATKKHPELEHLIQVCVAKATAGDDSLCLFAPYLCRSCFDKWLEFLNLYQLAIKTDEMIRKVLEKEVLESKIKEDDNNFHPIVVDKNLNKYSIDSEALIEIREIEKYETISPLFADSHSNITINVEEETTKEETTDFNESYDNDSGDPISFCSDKLYKINFSPHTLQNEVFEKAKKSTKSKKKLVKTICTLKSKYRTRKSTLNPKEDQMSTEMFNKNVDENGEDASIKKVRYQCKPCNKYFWEKNKYEGHMKQVHEGIKKPFRCSQCDKAYNLYKTLLQHKREYHSEKPQEIFKCHQCDKIFKTAVILKQHITNKHSDQKEAMRSICDQCGFIAAHQYSLSRHIINKHTETDQVKCDQCPKVFKTQYSLKYHILGNHNPSNIKPFKCSECQMGFTRKTLLNQHKRTHLKYTERIKCDFEGCEVRFVKHGDKTHHMRLVHLKVKQHVCDFCGEAFGAMQTLRHHRFIHTGEKPYKCNVCGQGFRQRTAMKTHRKTHFGKETKSQDVINNLPETNLSLINTINS